MMVSKSPSSPFIYYGGKPYLIANLTLDLTDDRPHLHDVLVDLLAKQEPFDILLLRPLSQDEEGDLQQALGDAEVDAWAHLVGSQK